MPARWRFVLVAIVAAAIVGGFMPHGTLSAAESAASEMVQVAGTPLASLPNCADVTCGKGSPAPPAPAPMVALAGLLGGLGLAALAVTRWRRLLAQVAPLAAGTRDRLFRPPQYS